MQYVLTHSEQLSALLPSMVASSWIAALGCAVQKKFLPEQITFPLKLHD